MYQPYKILEKTRGEINEIFNQRKIWRTNHG